MRSSLACCVKPKLYDIAKLSALGHFEATGFHLYGLNSSNGSNGLFPRMTLGNREFLNGSHLALQIALMK